MADVRSGPSGTRPTAARARARPERKKPNAETTFSPSTCGPDVAKTPIRLEPIRPAATTNAMISRLNATSSLLHELVEPLVHEADLDLAVAHLLEHVVHLVRVLGEDRGELDDSRRARASMRCGV